MTALTAGPLTPGPVTQVDQEGFSGTPPIVDGQYAASYAQYAQLPSPESAPINSVTSSQFQAQDEAGNIVYGYQNVNSAKQERGNIHGGVESSYSYVDEAGVHTVNYVADDLGFRIVGDNLPVAGVGIAPRFATFSSQSLQTFFSGEWRTPRRWWRPGETSWPPSKPRQAGPRDPLRLVSLALAITLPCLLPRCSPAMLMPPVPSTTRPPLLLPTTEPLLLRMLLHLSVLVKESSPGFDSTPGTLSPTDLPD